MFFEPIKNQILKIESKEKKITKNRIYKILLCYDHMSSYDMSHMISKMKNSRNSSYSWIRYFFWIWPKTVYRAKIKPKNTVLIFVHLKGMKIRNPARGIYLHLSRIMQNFILGFRIFDGQKFSFKLMSDQQGLK